MSARRKRCHPIRGLERNQSPLCSPYGQRTHPKEKEPAPGLAPRWRRKSFVRLRAMPQTQERSLAGGGHSAICFHGGRCRSSLSTQERGGTSPCLFQASKDRHRAELQKVIRALRADDGATRRHRPQRRGQTVDRDSQLVPAPLSPVQTVFGWLEDLAGTAFADRTVP
jgi:hypothetical protein